MVDRKVVRHEKWHRNDTFTSRFTKIDEFVCPFYGRLQFFNLKNMSKKGKKRG